MPLTDVAIRKAKPSNKTQRLFDGGGMYLEISPAGGKWWRLKYRFNGKEKRLSLGTYPDTSLSDARAARDAARKLLVSGIDPSAHRKASKAAGEERAGNSFEVITYEWFARQSAIWTPNHADKTISRLKNNVFPWLGKYPITEITAKEILATMNRIADRGAVRLAHHCLQYCNQVFRYAIVSGRAERNPAADLRGALPSFKVTHHATMTDPKAIGELLRAMEGYTGGFIARCALHLSPLLFVRPGELRYMEWTEIDFDNTQWNLPAEKMKMRIPHIVPLSRQAMAVLRDLHPLTGHGRYAFPNERNAKRPISDNTINAALRRMGYDKHTMTGHGFRAMARTVLDEVLHFRPDYIEHQLAHAVRDPNGRAYNRTSFLPERRQMMQAWADYLDVLKADTGKGTSVKTESGESR